MASFGVLFALVFVSGIVSPSLVEVTAFSGNLALGQQQAQQARLRRLSFLLRRSVAPILEEIPAPSFEEPLVDIRSSALFAALHIRGATSIPLPELQRRAYELPAPFEAKIRLCGGAEKELDEASDLLTELGWEVLPSFTLDAQEALEALESGTSSGSLSPQEWRWRGVAVEVGDASVRCWRPSSFLAKSVSNLQLADTFAIQGNEQLAVDLGCGSGRDAVFLAASLGENCKVVGVDNHKKALERAAALAEREGVQHRVEWKLMDLRKSAGLEAISDMKINLVHGCRFLDRRVIERLRDSSLQVGGVFIWSTFMEGEENLAPPFRPSRRLFSGELRYMFQRSKDRKYKIIIDEEGHLNTRSLDVPASFFCAQRVA